MATAEGQPNPDLAVEALLIPYTWSGPADRWHAWQQWAVKVLAQGALRLPLPESPQFLNPKSPAWRQLQALAAPLTDDERASVERLAAGDTDPDVLALLWGRLQERLHHAERQDAARWRQEDRGRLRGARIGAEKRGPGSEKITAEYARERAVQPDATHQALCKKVAGKLDISASRVRHVVPSPRRAPSPAKPTLASLRPRRHRF